MVLCGIHNVVGSNRLSRYVLSVTAELLNFWLSFRQVRVNLRLMSICQILVVRGTVRQFVVAFLKACVLISFCFAVCSHHKPGVVKSFATMQVIFLVSNSRPGWCFWTNCLCWACPAGGWTKIFEAVCMHVLTICGRLLPSSSFTPCFLCVYLCVGISEAISELTVNSRQASMSRDNCEGQIQTGTVSCKPYCTFACFALNWSVFVSSVQVLCGCHVVLCMAGSCISAHINQPGICIHRDGGLLIHTVQRS